MCRSQFWVVSCNSVCGFDKRTARLVHVSLPPLTTISMRQPSLFEVLSVEDPRKATNATASSSKLEVYDFFAGAGGFSTGAKEAGCRVVYVCDSCPLALETHKRNHPTVEHQCLQLPSREAVARLPTDGRRFHVHCSPPCVKLSRINTANVVAKNRGAHGLDDAADMIEWSLEMMLASQCTSWSLEQVGDCNVRTIVERVRKRHPTRIAYAVIDLRQLGVPQTRTRLVAAPPALLARLLRKCSSGRVRTVRDVISKPRGTHVRSGRSIFQVRKRLNPKPGETKWINARAGWADWCTDVTRPAPTVRARHAHTWVTLVDGKAIDHRVMHPNELAALQTFPEGYKLPDRKFDAYLQVGNAVPPLLARLLLEEEAAIKRPGLPLGEPLYLGRVRELVRVRVWVRG